MTIYVQSRGKNQDEDYRWLRIKSNEYYPENPEFLLQSIGDLRVRPTDLIESQKPSIILSATKNDYCLLVTGLKSRKERNDFTGRPVRNSVLWICQKDRENLLIRSLLIRALRGELDQKIDKTIINNGQYGFEVNYKSLKELSNASLAIGNNNQTNPSFTACKIGKNYDSLREEIALELESNVLPDKDGLLVLLTSIKSASALKETRVWRGLSNRVEFETLEKYSSSAIIQSGTGKKTLWIWVAIALILIITIALLIFKLTIPQQPQIEPNPQIQEESIQLQEMSNNSLEKVGKSSNCLQVTEIKYTMSPCFSNVENN